MAISVHNSQFGKQTPSWCRKFISLHMLMGDEAALSWKIFDASKKACDATGPGFFTGSLL